MKSHCHASAYAFQIKKCSDATCFYCMQHLPRLLPEEFERLHFLPLPLLDTSEQHYLKFEELYGKQPSNSDQPSKVATPSEESKKNDKARKSVLVAGKVRATIVCGECFKPRCVYDHFALLISIINLIPIHACIHTL